MTCSRESRVSLRASIIFRLFFLQQGHATQASNYYTCTLHIYTMLVQVVIKFLEMLDPFVLIDLFHNGAKRGKRDVR